MKRTVAWALAAAAALSVLGSAALALEPKTGGQQYLEASARRGPGGYHRPPGPPGGPGRPGHLPPPPPPTPPHHHYHGCGHDFMIGGLYYFLDSISGNRDYDD